MLFLKYGWLSHTSILRETEGMGKLKIGVVEKAVCRGHERLKVLGKVSSKFVIIGYIPIFGLLFILLAKLS